MSLARTLTTVTIFTMLGAAAGLQQITPQNQCSTDLTLHNPFALFNKCPNVFDMVPETRLYFFDLDKKHIRRFILNYQESLRQSIQRRLGFSNSAHEEFINAILALRSLNPFWENCIDLVFTHSPNFRILFCPRTRPLLNPQESMFYHADISTFMINNDLTLGNAYFATLRHSLRHAVTHTIQQTLDVTTSVNYSPTFPDDRENSLNFLAMLEQGDKRIFRLKQQLELESNDLLKDSNRKKLNELREKYKKIFINCYNTQVNANVYFETSPTINELIKLSGGGETLTKDFDAIPPEQNDFISYEALLDIQDPIATIVKIISNQIQDTQTLKLNAREYGIERDVLLFTALPIEIIAEFYPELLAYANGLIYKALNTPMVHQSNSLPKFDEQSDLMQPPTRQLNKR